MAQRVLLLTALLGFFGCASIVPTPGPGEAYFKHHYILAREDGYSMSTERGLLRHGALKRAEAGTDIDDRVLQGVERHARRIWPDLREGDTKGDRTLEILVFVHGGLNGYGDDFGRMRQMLATPDDCAGERQPTKLFVSAECGNAVTSYYPIFVNWNSDLWDSIRDDLFVIRRGNPNPIIGFFTWPFVLGARLAEAVFAAPYSWVSNAEDFLDANPEGHHWLEGSISLVPRSLATPLVKAFGTSAWQIMKRRAALVASPEFASREYEGAAYTLLRRLGGRIDRDGYWLMIDPPNARVRVAITFVGHSMGAIVINRLLAASIHLDRPLPVTRIVYLAPASSINDIAVTNLFRLQHPRTRFWTFALRREDEAWERHLISPRGTLLVWIDNYFESVVEAGDARYGRTQSYRTRYNLFGDWAKPRGNEPFNVCEWASDDRPTTHHAVGNATYLATALSHVGPEVFKKSPPPAADGTLVCASPPFSEERTAGDADEVAERLARGR